MDMTQFLKPSKTECLLFFPILQFPPFPILYFQNVTSIIFFFYYFLFVLLRRKEKEERDHILKKKITFLTSKPTTRDKYTIYQELVSEQLLAVPEQTTLLGTQFIKVILSLICFLFSISLCVDLVFVEGDFSIFYFLFSFLFIQLMDLKS